MARKNGCKKPMNIQECYKILELKYGASMEDARMAYKDMVRVWHPDRFGGNPRLRAKANEKLKELNLAYGEIRHFLAKDLEMDTGAEEGVHPEKQRHAATKPFHFSKIIGEFLSTLFHFFAPGTKAQKYLRILMFSRIHPKQVPPEPSRTYNGRLHRSSGSKRAGNKKRKPFSEVLHEVATARKRRTSNAHGSNKGTSL
jgi:DnaJ-class molecular chaperone